MLKTPTGFTPLCTATARGQARVHLFWQGQYFNSADRPKRLTLQQVEAEQIQSDALIPIGRLHDQDHFAVLLSDHEQVLTLQTQAGWKLAGLRSWFGHLDDEEMAIAMRGVQLAEWYRTHRYCGACGAITELVTGERALRCNQCQLSFYPRIAPAMMALVTNGSKLLLARGVNFPPGRFSALAGFLEPGESVEESIRREVFEEVGLEVGRLQYFASQSWPFPNSLMLAFRAEYVSGQIQIDPGEIAEAGWFEIDQLPQLPPRISIARSLIESTCRLIETGQALY